MVSPERVELSSLAPEASTLSVELRGHAARATAHSIPRRRPFNKMPDGEISGENPEKINFAAGYCNALTAVLYCLLMLEKIRS